MFICHLSERDTVLGCTRGWHKLSTYDITIVEDKNLSGSSDKGYTEYFILNGAQCLCRDN